MRLGPGDQVLVVGTKGSGKSTLATTWASTDAWGRSLIFDPKLDENAIPRDRTGRPTATIAWGVGAAARLLRHRAGRIVYRPTPDDFTDLPSAFDELVRLMYQDGGGRALILHETADVAPASGSRRFLSAMWRQSRSLMVPIVALTQRPRGIDLHAVTEPAHVALFDVNHPEDRRLIAQLVGLDTRRELPRPSRPFAFLHYTAGGRLVEHAPYRELVPLRADLTLESSG